MQFGSYPIQTSKCVVDMGSVRIIFESKMLHVFSATRQFNVPRAFLLSEGRSIK